MILDRLTLRGCNDTGSTAHRPTLRHAATRTLEETRVRTYQSQPPAAALPSTTARSHRHKRAPARAPGRAPMAVHLDGEAGGASASSRDVRHPSLPPVPAVARTPQRQYCCGEMMMPSLSSRPRHSARLLCCCVVDPGVRADCCPPRGWCSAAEAGCAALALPGSSTSSALVLYIAAAK